MTSSCRWIDGFVPLAVGVRSGLPETVHHGVVVALDTDGSVALRIGDPSTVIYPRSSNKPMQAVAMLRCGLVLPDDQLAVACSSHDGGPAHLACVRRILADAGLDEGALANTPALPLDSAERDAALLAGTEPSALQMTCSGKTRRCWRRACTTGGPAIRATSTRIIRCSDE